MTKKDTDQDSKLWQQVTKTIKPLDRSTTHINNHGVDHAPEQSKQTPSKTKKAHIDHRITPQNPPSEHHTPPIQDKSIDRRTEQKLKRGQIPVDITLDMHGMIQVDAHQALTRTVMQAASKGQRLILVITGKGLRSKEPGGILRKKLKDWCGTPPLSHVILKIIPAPRHHGGDGAYYLYLRRNRLKTSL